VLASHAGDGAAVVAVGRAGEARAVAADLERPVDRPRRSEDLERGQPQPARLVLDPHASDAERLGGGTGVHERRRCVARQRAVEVVGGGGLALDAARQRVGDELHAVSASTSAA
jgi:hypothetical protein